MVCRILADPCANFVFSLWVCFFWDWVRNSDEMMMLASLQSSNMASRLLQDATTMINCRETELGDQEALTDAVKSLPDDFREIDEGNCQEVLLGLHCIFLYAFILFDLGFCFWRKLCYSTRTTTMLGQRPTCKVQKHFGCQQAVCRHYKGQVPSKVDGKACCESAICSVEGICADGCFVRDHHKGMGFQTVVSRLYCELY